MSDQDQYVPLTEVNQTQPTEDNVEPAKEVTDTPDADSQDEAKKDKPAKTFTQEELNKKVAREKDKAARSATKALQEEIAALREQMTAKDTKDATQDTAPKRDDFESYEDYLEARAEWKADQKINARLAEVTKEREQEKTNSKQSEVQQTFERQAGKMVSAGNAKYSDFDDVINEAVGDGLLIAGSPIHHAAVESELGHEVLYYLSRNPEEAERINELSSTKQLIEFGKLEVKLSEPKKQKDDPIDAVGNRSNNSTNLANKSTEEFIRIRNKQELERR